MDSHNFNVFVLIWLCFFREAITIKKNVALARGFQIYRTISISQRSCNCSMSFSCSCCQNVVILYTKEEKDLCVNFTYQRNGLNIDVALSSDIISTRTITNYRAFQFCVFVPGCLFSTACVNILELNLFPRSITSCLRLDIYTKKQLWQINYTCISVSTELPMMLANATNMPETSTERMSMMGNRQMGRPTMMVSTTEMASTQMMTMGMLGMSTSAAARMTEQANEMTEMNSQMNSQQIEQVTAD